MIQDNKEDYYSIDAESNSRFSAINPEQGGSIKKYLDFIKIDEEKVESISMERGSIIHKFIEEPENFLFLEIDKPSDKLGEVADEAIRNVKLRIEELGNPSATIIDLDPYVINACRAIGWNSKYGDEALLKNAGVIKPYINQMLEDDGTKITTDRKSKEIITNAIQSLYKHKIATLELLDEYSTKDNVKVYKEESIYWKLPYSDNGEEKYLDCKAKIDQFRIQFDEKVIVINDLKTGEFNIGNFDGTFKYKRIARQLAWYKKAVIEFCMQKEINIDHFEFKFNVIAVETKDEFRTAVFPVNDLWILKGQEEYTSLLQRIIFHKQNGFEMSMEEYMNDGYMLLKNPE